MLSALFNLFFPPLCAGCRQLLLPFEEIICTGCRHDLPFTCHGNLLENEAYLKFYGKSDIESAQCLLYYAHSGIVRECIHDLKYRGNQSVGRVFADMVCADEKNTAWLSGADVIVPVPLHPRKFRQRGYNQVTTFASRLSEHLDIPLDHHLLVRNFHSSSQTRSNRFGRANLKKELFSVRGKEIYQGKHLLLVDDVLTTGATLSKCISALNEIPGIRVSVACMAFSTS